MQIQIQINIKSSCRVFITYPSFEVRQMNHSNILFLLSSKLFRIFFQIIDFITLDVNYLNYMHRYLNLSVMYFSLGIIFNCFNQEIIFQRYQYNINEISSNDNFNDIFNTFLRNYFNILLDSLLPTLQYVTKFYRTELDVTIPQKHAIVSKKEEVFILLIMISHLTRNFCKFRLIIKTISETINFYS